MKLILSTSNIMGSSGGNSSLLLRRHHRAFEKSNTELTASLRANIVSRQQQFPVSDSSSSNDNNKTDSHTPPLSTWTHHDPASDSLYVPSPPPPTGPPLSEPRAAYDITVKLFYLVHSRSFGNDTKALAAARGAQAREALRLVTRELGVDGVDLLIVSFPGISFSADDESEDQDEEDEEIDADGADGERAVDEDGFEPGDDDEMRAMLATHRSLDILHAQGLVDRLGVAELGTRRLARFLRRRLPPYSSSPTDTNSSSATTNGDNLDSSHPHSLHHNGHASAGNAVPPLVRPSVNQINLRDCCVVPRPLILLARSAGVELLTHNDCTDILPRGTLRSILGAPPSSSTQTNGNSNRATSSTSYNGTSQQQHDCIDASTTANGASSGGVGLLSSRLGKQQRSHTSLDEINKHNTNGHDEGDEHDVEEVDDDVAPLFVVKYTAVVRDRGVVENKGYFAVAELADAWGARHLKTTKG